MRVLLLLSLSVSLFSDAVVAMNEAAETTTCEEKTNDTTVVGRDRNEDDDDGHSKEELSDDRTNCIDNDTHCRYWARLGECKKNPVYMLDMCQRSCNVCGKQIGSNPRVTAALKQSDRNADEEDQKNEKEDDEEEEEEEEYLDTDDYYYVPSLPGVPQLVHYAYDGDLTTEDVVEVIGEGQDYLENTVYADEFYEKVWQTCKNKQTECAHWAAMGECDDNETFMKLNCPVVCQSCELLHVETACPVDPDAINAWQPGDINAFFERLTADDSMYTNEYDLKVLSRPDYRPGDTNETSDLSYIIGPWVVTMENFLTQEEADTLIQLGTDEGYERSADVGEMNDDGTVEAEVNSGRTSTNAWCGDECYEHEVTKRIIERIQSMTGTPDDNNEDLQLLRYEEGQFYETHHDYIPHQYDRMEGVRVLTVFLYLNDVEAGGGTNFPRLGDTENGGLTVMPKRGRVLIWPSVLNDDPDEWDPATHHQALPVEKGIKYGANAWVHQRNFTAAWECEASMEVEEEEDYEEEDYEEEDYEEEDVYEEEEE